MIIYSSSSSTLIEQPSRTVDNFHKRTVHKTLEHKTLESEDLQEKENLKMAEELTNMINGIIERLENINELSPTDELTATIESIKKGNQIIIK